MARELDFYLYLDDAHGTTVYGRNGEGSVLDAAGGVPERTFVTFSLTKGFGAAGGGVLLPDAESEHVVRTYGQVCAFSAPLDFASVNACRAVVRLHAGDAIRDLQRELRERVALFDRRMGHELPFSPIRMVEATSESEALTWGTELIRRGYFVSTVMFPVVPREQPQLRVCIAANHTEEEVVGLTEALRDLQMGRLRPLAAAAARPSPPAKLVPLSPHFGKRIGGSRLRDLGPECVDRLRETLYREKVVVIEDVEWDLASYLKFARMFGKPITFVDESYRHPEHREVFVVSNVPPTSGQPKIGKDRVGYYWHSDSSFCSEPLAVTMLHAQVVPPSGGETAFVDMQALYKELPPPLRELVDGLSAVHEGQWRYLVEPSDVGLSILEILERDTRQVPPSTHPMVIRHPATDAKALYISEGVTRRVVGLEAARGEALLADLFQRVTASARYVHRWAKNDLVIWDNRSVVHRAYPAPAGQHRLLHRVGVDDGGFFAARAAPEPVSRVSAARRR